MGIMEGVGDLVMGNEESPEVVLVGLRGLSHNADLARQGSHGACRSTPPTTPTLPFESLKRFEQSIPMNAAIHPRLGPCAGSEGVWTGTADRTVLQNNSHSLRAQPF